jgi:hypothetical protein
MFSWSRDTWNSTIHSAGSGTNLVRSNAEGFGSDAEGGSDNSDNGGDECESDVGSGKSCLGSDVEVIARAQGSYFTATLQMLASDGAVTASTSAAAAAAAAGVEDADVGVEDADVGVEVAPDDVEAPLRTTMRRGWVVNYCDLVDPARREHILAQAAALFGVDGCSDTVERMLAAFNTYSKVGAAVKGGTAVNDSAAKQRTADAVPGLQAALDRWCMAAYTQLEEHPCRIR